MSENGALPPADAPAPERQSFPFLVLQFFVFPLAIVGVCVAVFVLFGLIASEGKGAREYLSEVRTGGTNRRWQAAFELSKVLQAGKDPALSDPAFAQEVARTFEEAQNDDPRVRRYLAVALGRLGRAEAVPALLRALTVETAPADRDPQIYLIWALGSIRDPAAVPALVRLAASEDPGVRKAAIHALGPFRAAPAREALLRSLEDAAEDVRWNAALALGRQGEESAGSVLLKMMDRAYLARVPGLTPEQQEEAVLQAVGASARLRDVAVQAALQGLRTADPNLKVREAARRALEAPRP